MRGGVGLTSWGRGRGARRRGADGGWGTGRAGRGRRHRRTPKPAPDLEGGASRDPRCAAAVGDGRPARSPPIGEQRGVANSGNFDPSYASKVDNAVSWITGRGMVALLDLHYNPIVPCGHVGLHEMADAPNSINFWEQVAARYKSNPLVAFDLYNEPNNIPDSVWLNGGQASEGRTVFNAAGMQQMYDAIRGQGAN